MNTTSPTGRFAKFVCQFQFAVEKPRQDVGNGSKPEVMSNVRWHGDVGYVELGSASGALARIELSDRHTVGTFTGFRVDIISRTQGKLDTLFFDFNEHMDPGQRDDNRLDHKGFHGWSSGREAKSIAWYIATPTLKNIKAFTAAVNEYLAMWQGSHLFGTR